MKKKILLSALVLVFAFGTMFGCMGPNLKQYESLKDPQISEKPNRKMLVVEVGGDPNKTGGKAISNLFSTFFKIKGVKMSAPRARWPKSIGTTPKDQWIGVWGLPIPNDTEKLPDKTPADIKIQEWEYGKVAEILHIGPYSAETPTIEKLHKFIKDSGYEIVGDHEEEYLKGPGMFGKGNPEKYWTIIRYRIKKI